MSNEKANIIQQKSFKFALTSIDLYIKLKSEKEYVISKQLLRSATSIGANVEEAIAASSKRDFAHKIGLSLKEVRETYYWLRLLDQSKLTNIETAKIRAESLELIKILSAILKTTRLNHLDS